MSKVNLRNELEKIRLANGGMLTEEAVIEAARPKRHPLHNRFTWDDTKAAKRWRIEEARRLIVQVVVTIARPRNRTVSVRAYASLPTDRAKGGGYRSIQDILSNRRQRTELLAAALSELEAFKKRYGKLAELGPIFDALAMVQGIKSRKPKAA